MTTSTDDLAAIRRHLEKLTLKLAEAQAGSLPAVRASRKHAEAALKLLSVAEVVASERQADEARCHRCGASLAKGVSAGHAPTHARRSGQLPTSVKQMNADALDSPLGSL